MLPEKMANTSERKEKKLVWKAVTESCRVNSMVRASQLQSRNPFSYAAQQRGINDCESLRSHTLKSRWRTCAAKFSRCGCEYQAVVVAMPVMRKNLLRLWRLRIGDHAVSLHNTSQRLEAGSKRPDLDIPLDFICSTSRKHQHASRLAIIHFACCKSFISPVATLHTGYSPGVPIFSEPRFEPVIEMRSGVSVQVLTVQP